MYKLGIDVGGTNTDAVLLDEERKVVASVKRHTTPDAYDGILAAVRAVLEQAGVDRKEIGQAMLGTTQCTNAIVERKHLAPIGVLRRLKAVSSHCYMLEKIGRASCRERV